VVESAGIEPISPVPVESVFDAGQFVVPTGEEENIVFGTDMDIDWVSKISSLAVLTGTDVIQAVWDQFIEGASFEDAYGGTSTGF
jgi:hypothetical protein